MAQDQQTYRRGANAALIGLVVQIVLGVAMALLGLWAQSPALNGAAWHFFGGVIIWIILWLIYHQHQLERIEALEAEQLAREDQRAAALFADASDALDLARRRLEKLYKWGLGIVSAAAAIYLIVVGGLLLARHIKDLDGKRIDDPAILAAALGAQANPLALMFLTAAIAFVGFIVARYIAGMTKVREWQLLRGGASYLMGNIVVAVLTVLGAVAAVMDNRSALAALEVIVPGIMVLIGVEILVTFLLSAYRPRRPGEMPRPPFDSRVLGLLTSPESLGKIITDTINYQFGFEISRSWFYQLLNRAMPKLALTGVIVLLLLSCLVIVGAHEKAVVTVNGRITHVVDPGLHLKMPWPIGRAHLVAVERVHQISVGSAQSSPDTAILWTQQHTIGEEEFMVTAATPFELAEPDAAGDTEDDHIPGTPARTAPGTSLAAGEVIVQYRIIREDTGLLNYLRAAQNPETLIKALADRRVGAYFASHDLDALLAIGRTDAGDILRKQIQQDADELGLGIHVVYAGLTGIHPPQKSDVAASFHKQISSLQEKESFIEQAEREAIRMLSTVAGTREQATAINAAIVELESLRQRLADHSAGDEAQELGQRIAEQQVKVEQLLSQAGGQAAEKVFEARAYRWQRGITERAKAERFNAELRAYQQSPYYYRAKHYLDTLARGMAQARKYVILTDNQSPPVFQLELKDTRSAIESIFDDN